MLKNKSGGRNGVRKFFLNSLEGIFVVRLFMADRTFSG